MNTPKSHCSYKRFVESPDCPPQKPERNIDDVSSSVSFKQKSYNVMKSIKTLFKQSENKPTGEYQRLLDSSPQKMNDTFSKQRSDNDSENKK